MDIAALIAWIVTAAFGFTMFSMWLRNGGARGGNGTITHFNPPMVFGHFLLAAGGLVVWIVYLFADVTPLAWIAFADLLVVALFGDLLAYRWTRDHRVVAHAVGSMPAAAGLAEQRIPTPVVVVHGILAVTTIVLVLLAALGVGGS